LNVFERHIAAADDHLLLLAPPARPLPQHFSNSLVDDDLHAEYLAEVQRLRGTVYHADGAIRELTSDGRHEMPEDDRSWHFIALDSARRVCGCMWYREHERPRSIADLRVGSSPLATHPNWRRVIRAAVAGEMRRARARRVPYAEIGGWAASRERCGAVDALVLALTAFSFGRLAGGSLGIATATLRHCSASILRRLGGALLEHQGTPVPGYYDARYGCEMEILGFDSTQARPKFDPLVELLAGALVNVTVVATRAVELPRAAEWAAA
jgi:hypothetical protein